MTTVPTRCARRLHRPLSRFERDAFCVCFYGWTRVDDFMRSWRHAGFWPAGHLVCHKAYASRTHYLRARHEQAFLLVKGRPATPVHPLDDVLPLAILLQQASSDGETRHRTQAAHRVLLAAPEILCSTPLRDRGARCSQRDHVDAISSGSRSSLSTARQLARDSASHESWRPHDDLPTRQSNAPCATSARGVVERDLA